MTLEDAIRGAGFDPPASIERGRVIRFSTNGKRGDLAGWVFLFPDEQGAVFGDWRSGQEHAWQAHRDRPLSEAEQAEFRRKAEQAKREAATQREQEHQEAAARARSDWYAAKYATAEHAYLLGKRIQPHGMRVAADGRLMVPVHGPDSGIQSLQFIAPDGTKRFLKGGKMMGGHVWLGSPENASTALLAEGFGTAAALREATGFPVCVAFTAGNLAEVGRMVRAKFPAFRLLACGDDDRQTAGNPGRTKATAAAEAVGAGVVFPDFPAGADGTDFADLALYAGPAVVRAQILAAVSNPEPGPEPGAVIRLADWQAAVRFKGEPPERRWLIPGVFPLGKPALAAAAGGVGKSFLLLDLARSVAAGANGCALGPVEAHGAAVLLCAEDDAIEVHSRLAALGEIPARLIVVPCPDAGGVPSLFGLDEKGRSPETTPRFTELAAQFREIPGLRLIGFDPLQALCGGLDLNLPQHAQHVCGELARLASETGAAVIASHHFRKSGAITTPEAAREAIRGTGGLVDGVRSVYALWPAEEEDGKAKCKTLGIPWHRGRVVYGGVVKANFRADLGISIFVRDDSGILRDRRAELGLLAPKPDALQNALCEAIAKAAREQRPFTKTGQHHGLYSRRHELPSLLHETGKHRLEELAQGLLNGGALVQGRMKPTESAPGKWLDVPGGPLAVQSEEFTRAELAKTTAVKSTDKPEDEAA
jgi:phage/plasmid primase-like uncharacterized protein